MTNPAAALSADRFLCHELSDSPEWHRTELTVTPREYSLGPTKKTVLQLRSACEQIAALK